MEKKQLYKQLPWSLKNYMLTYWYFWIVLLIIFLVSISIFYKLSQNSYFSHEMVEEKTIQIEVLGIRSDIFTTVLVSNPFDIFKSYEIDLGYSCRIKKDLLNTKIKMKSVLYKRNYSKTLFIDFPEAKQKLCIKERV